MATNGEHREIIAKKPTPFCTVRKDDPPEKKQAATRAWMENIARYETFWNDPARQNNGEPAWLGYWCGKCGGHHEHDVNTHGPIAKCPKCGNRVDLRPEGEFGGMDR